MIKNLMFDLGGVIMEIKRDNAVEALKQIGLDDADNLLGEFGQKGLFLQLERGEITPDQFHAALRRDYDFNAGDDEIDEAFSRFLIGIPLMRLRELELLKEDYKIFMLSNTNKIMWDRVILDCFKEDGHDIDYYFDGVIASFDVHAYKPDAEIFRMAENMFGINPSETIFFDDSRKNVEAAEKLGFKGVHVTDNRPLFQWLNNLG